MHLENGGPTLLGETGHESQVPDGMPSVYSARQERGKPGDQLALPSGCGQHVLVYMPIDVERRVGNPSRARKAADPGRGETLPIAGEKGQPAGDALTNLL
jgi:hypothetical protein